MSISVRDVLVIVFAPSEGTSSRENSWSAQERGGCSHYYRYCYFAFFFSAFAFIQRRRGFSPAGWGGTTAFLIGGGTTTGTP
jgi:hypothetical protein